MAISQPFTRPVATQTASKTGSWTAFVTEDSTNKQFIIDIVDTINTNAKLVKRLKFPLTYGGTTLSPLMTILTFAGSAANYASSTSPADSLAVASQTIAVDSIDMDAFHTAAGDTRS